MASELEQKVEKMRAEMFEMFGDKLPDPEHEPIRFDYYIRLFLYEKTVRNENA